MNPSTEDMLNAIEKVNAEHIFILPNNKNIILAANQAKAALVRIRISLSSPPRRFPRELPRIINYHAGVQSAEDNARPA